MERRGDLIALNEHLFDSMWTYWRAAQFMDCIACCDRATALAGRLGIPPVQYGTIKSFALVDLGRFDEAWQALKQEVADDEHPFGQAFQHLGRTFWYASAGDFERVIRDVPRVLADARKLQRTWMIPWADDLLASAIVGQRARRRGRSDAARRGSRPPADTSPASRLSPRNSAPAMPRRRSLNASAACRSSKAKAGFGPIGSFEELQGPGAARARPVRRCLRARSKRALAFVVPLGWRSLAWRLQRLAGGRVGRDSVTSAAAAERRTAVELLTAVAGTLSDTSVRAPFPVAARRGQTAGVRRNENESS